jgi:hypothetical protein
MRLVRFVYWLVTGALLGLGIVTFTGLGLILFPVGVVLLFIGIFVMRGREARALVLGFGGLPEALFVNALVNGAPTTGPTGQFYVGGAIVFGAISLLGLIVLFASGRGSRPATT